MHEPAAAVKRSVPRRIYFATQDPARDPPTMPRKRTGNGPTTDTRERIADAALALFNTEGWHAVSTRHIATRLGISPGNLYYHFANKEEIALCLYERIERQLDAMLAPPVGAHDSFDDVLAYLDAILGHLWEFRFFYRDLNSLLREVPGLKDQYRGLAERVLGRARTIFAGWSRPGGWKRATSSSTCSRRMHGSC